VDDTKVRITEASSDETRGASCRTDGLNGLPWGRWMFEIHDRLVYRPATLVFRTVHIDRAGETVSQRVVSAAIADVNADGDALLVSDDGAHLWFPVASACDRRRSRLA